VTTVLSNDATAVVLTPAVYAVTKRTKGDPLPYLFACAFIANAASFVLPISNPANLVMFGNNLPPLLPWLRIFLLPAGAAILATYFTMRLLFRRALRGEVPVISRSSYLFGVSWPDVRRTLLVLALSRLEIQSPAHTRL